MLGRSVSTFKFSVGSGHSVLTFSIPGFLSFPCSSPPPYWGDGVCWGCFSRTGLSRVFWVTGLVASVTFHGRVIC